MFKFLEGSVLDSEEKHILTLSKKSRLVELPTFMHLWNCSFRISCFRYFVFFQLNYNFAAAQ